MSRPEDVVRRPNASKELTRATLRAKGLSWDEADAGLCVLNGPQHHDGLQERLSSTGTAGANFGAGMKSGGISRCVRESWTRGVDAPRFIGWYG